VGSGRGALDAVIAYRPDVAFLDLVLPPPDGFTICEMLMRNVGPPVVLMTGMSNPNTTRVSEVGAVMLLRKPFVREAVVEALAVALEKCRRNEASGGAAFATR
jgi:CheY-like chemotaxis protein